MKINFDSLDLSGFVEDLIEGIIAWAMNRHLQDDYEYTLPADIEYQEELKKAARFMRDHYSLPDEWD